MMKHPRQIALYTWLAAWLSPLGALAVGGDVASLTACRPTPSVPSIAASHPGEAAMIPSNRLARPAGKGEAAEGQVVALTGRVVDENCVPVSGAVVDLWQVGKDGVYRFASAGDLASPDPVFAGNGRAVTDNYGRFGFLTLFPAPAKNGAPQLRLRVTHTDFDPLHTVMFFGGDHRNEWDGMLRSLRAEDRPLLLGDVSYRQTSQPDSGVNVAFTVTLKGKNPYRSY